MYLNFFCNISAFRSVINSYCVGVGKPTRFDGRVECDRLDALSDVRMQDAVRVQTLFGFNYTSVQIACAVRRGIGPRLLQVMSGH